MCFGAAALAAPVALPWAAERDEAEDAGSWRSFVVFAGREVASGVSFAALRLAVVVVDAATGGDGRAFDRGAQYAVAAAFSRPGVT